MKASGAPSKPIATAWRSALIWLLQAQEQMPGQANVTMFEDIVKGLHAIRSAWRCPATFPISRTPARWCI